ncbi:MAG TPA: phosphoribosylanthranilate isomerase [Gemmataceae bacterium]|jgi:phosphoribosylanthranilate isomerase
MKLFLLAFFISAFRGWQCGGMAEWRSGGALTAPTFLVHLHRSPTLRPVLMIGPVMSYHVRVKICGITTAEDARQAASLGADAIGLNFYAGSPRCVEASVAQIILRDLPPFVSTVGVFVETPLSKIIETLRGLDRIHIIQWHGKNPELGDCFPYRFVRAFAVRDESSLDAIQRYLDACRAIECLPSALLLDGYATGQHGGTGQTAPWQLLESFRPGVPIILAGGLTPDNVAEAIRIVRPYGVDVASGIESAPGRKDAEKMRRFLTNAREAAARLA